MASHRTTLILDEETQKAARELAARYGCSFSEAIRRAVLRHRANVFGVWLKAEVRECNSSNGYLSYLKVMMRRWRFGG